MKLIGEEENMTSNSNPAFRITIKYVFFGSLWILLSDQILILLFGPSEHLILFQTLKGWGFVIATSFILFLIIHSSFDRYQRSKNNLNLILGASPSVNYQLEKKGKEYIPLWVSENIQPIFGYSKKEAMNKGWWFSNIHPLDLQKAISFSSELERNGTLVHEYRFRHKNSDYLWVRDELHILKDSKKTKIFGCWTNITKDKKNQDLVRLNSVVLSNIKSGVLVFQHDGVIVTVNNALEKITDYSSDELIGKQLIGFCKKVINLYDLKSISKSVERDQRWEGEVDVFSRKGIKYSCFVSIGSFLSSSDNSLSYYVVITDIGDVKDKEKNLYNLTYYDDLTGIPNKTSMYIELENQLKKTGKEEEKIAVLFLGLDRFKRVNESVGHDIGDTILTLVASRLKQAILHTNASIYRFGGDEFVVILNQINSRTEARELAEVLRSSLSAPVTLERHGDMNISASIGASIYPFDGISSSELLSNAEAAMNEAKLSVGSYFSFYSKELTLEARSSLSLEFQLSQAVKLNELKLFYQPVIDSKTGRVIGAEALVRWQHPSQGLMSPIHFIPLAENTGLIIEIGSWVIENAIKQVGEWIGLGFNPGVIAINIASKQINQNLCGFLSTCLEKYNVSASNIELEITESCFVGTEVEVTEIFKSLKHIGVKLAIDDFGTGYSSLSYLRVYPLDKLKVDRSFICDVDDNSRAQEMVKAIVSMAHALQLDVQAEGIETPKQLDYIKSIGCEFWQGYLFSKPISSDLYLDLIANDDTNIE